MPCAVGSGRNPNEGSGGAGGSELGVGGADVVAGAGGAVADVGVGAGGASEPSPSPATAPGCGDPGQPDMAGLAVRFKGRDFPFAMVVADDGAGLAGGWQETSPTLSFGYGTEWWTCKIRVGMPLRTELLGTISAVAAASYTASAANAATDALWPPTVPPVPPVAFCSQLKSGMQAQLNSIKGLGALMMVPQ